MNLRQRIADWLAPERRVVTVENLLPLMGLQTSSGEHVSARSAEGLAAVTASINLIASGVASLPLHLYRRTDGGREREESNPLHRVLHTQASESQTALEFREQMTAAALATGNAYALREYDGRGRLVSLVPVLPQNVAVTRATSGRIVYDITGADGSRRRYTRDEVFHLRDRSDDGIVGRSRIDRARESMGLAQAVVRHGASTFKNGVRPSGVVEMAGSLSEQAFKKMSDYFNRIYSGTGAAGQVIPLDNGMKFTPLTLSAADAQFVESLGWSVEEVARLFGVPASLIGGKADSYSAASSLVTDFVTFTLRSWLVRWEQSIAGQLIGDAPLFAEHAVDGLLRSDPKVRSDVYHLALADGWMTPNEVRRLENLPPIDGGDVPRPRQLPGPTGLGSGEQPAPSRGT